MTSILILIAIIQLSTLYFTYIILKRKDEAEQRRFREFVKAIKAEDLQEYAASIPEDISEKKEEEKEDQFMELDQVPPEQLVKAFRGDRSKR